MGIVRRTLKLAALLVLCANARPNAVAQEWDGGGSPVGYNMLNDGKRAEYHGHLTEAIADATKAISMSPTFAAAYFFRATFYSAGGRYAEALADLDRVAAMHPDTQLVFVWRAKIAIQQRQGKLALDELAHAAGLPTAALWHQSDQSGDGEEGPGLGAFQIVSVHLVSNMYAYRSIAYELLGDDDTALDDLEKALQNETEKPWEVFGAHCYEAAVAGLLDMAEFTCGQAIKKGGGNVGNYGSLGLVHLKKKAWAKAIMAYSTSLAGRTGLPFSLYGRGIAKRANGDRAGGDADIEAAKAGEPDIAGIMSRLGVVAN